MNKVEGLMLNENGERLLARDDCKFVLTEAKELTAIFIASRKTAEKSLNR